MDLSGATLALNLALILIGVGAAAYIAAAYCLRAICIHDLTIEAHRLRDQYARRLEAMRSGIAEVELITPGFEHTKDEASPANKSDSDDSPLNQAEAA